MILININGVQAELDSSISVSDLLNKQGYGDKLVAVAVGGSFVPKSLYDNTIINNEDDVEIVAPMQGG